MKSPLTPTAGDAGSTSLRARLKRARGAASSVLAAVMLACGGAAPASGPALGAAAADQAPRLPATAVVAARPQLPAGVLALGPLGSTQVVSGEVALKPRDPSALARYVRLVSEPGSPIFHRYLRPGQYAEEFGPSRSTVRAVSAALTRAGVRVTGVSANRLLIAFSGSVAHVSAAFGTGFERYRLVSGRSAFSSTGPARLPSSIAPAVQGVLGLNDVLTPHVVGWPATAPRRRASASSSVRSRAAGAGPTACTEAVAAAAQRGGYTQQQVARAYGLDPLYRAGADGSGETIAVYELQPVSLQNLRTFDTCNFGARRAAQIAADVTVVPVDGGQQLGEGNPPEAALDLDDVTAIAPGAHIEVYEAPASYVGLIDNFNAIVTQDTAETATSSWTSGCETLDEQIEPGMLQIEDDIFQQAAAQGQTFLEAAGDAGSDGCAGHSVTPTTPIISQQAEAAQPYVLSVGGTTMSADTTPPAEQVWNDGPSGGAGGGGPSAVWPSPAWQADSGVPGVNDTSVLERAQAANGAPFCSATPCREVPDVSALADELTGVTIYAGAVSNGWTTIGGTSSAAPLWAGILADIDSTAACRAEGGVGFVNPKLYAIAAVPAEYMASFNDITSGNNDAYGAAGGLFPAGPGYDMASGLGTPRVTGADGTDGLAYYLCSPSPAPTPVVTGVSPGAVPSGGGPVVISGRGFLTAGEDEVAGVQVGSAALSQAQFSVTSPTAIAAYLPPGSALAGDGTGTDGAGEATVTVTLKDGQTSEPGPASRIVYYPSRPDAPSSPSPEVYGVTSGGSNEAGGTTATVYGAGFDTGKGTPSVTFGGVPARQVAVLSDTELTVRVPPYSPSATSCRAGDHPAIGVCQVQVRVTTSTGSSPERPILPIFSGNLTNEGAPGTGELVPAPTEFDYFPTPRITSISVSHGSASELGGSIAVLRGVGLDEMATEWVNVGPYTSTGSADASFLSMTAREDVIQLPGEHLTSAMLSVPVTVETEGSLNSSRIRAAAPSNTILLRYAPNPRVSSVVALRHGVPSRFAAGPTTGGTQLRILGSGLAGSFNVIFLDTSAFTYTAQASLERVGNRQVTLRTPVAVASIDSVLVCNATACSAPRTARDSFTYFPPGAPRLLSISRRRGPTGIFVTLRGRNLGFARAVYFGSVRAAKVANYPTLLASGGSTLVKVLVPKLKLGKTYFVRIVTLESEVTGSGPSPVDREVTFTAVQ